MRRGGSILVVLATLVVNAASATSRHGRARQRRLVRHP